MIKKLNSLLRVKETELYDIQFKLSEINSAISKEEESLNAKNILITELSSEMEKCGMSNSFRHNDIIFKIKDECKNINLKKKELLNIKEEITSELVNKKQEIKTIELLVAKKKQERIYELDKIEQNELDEMNIV